MRCASMGTEREHKMSSEETDPCTSSRQDDVAGSMTKERPKLLEGIGSTAVSLTHYALRKSRQLPCLVGSTITVVGDIVSPHLQPLATRVEKQGMYLLSLADDKLYTVGGAVEKNVPLVSTIVCKARVIHSFLGQATTVGFTVYERVRGHGVIVAAAETWVDYKDLAKTKAEQALQFAGKLPLLNIFVPIVRAVGTPVAVAVSDWLMKQSEVQDKHLFLQEVHLLPDGSDTLKGVPEGKRLFVVQHETEESSTMKDQADAQQSYSAKVLEEKTFAGFEGYDYFATVKKGDLFKEVDSEKVLFEDTTGKGIQTDVKAVVPISYSDEDSDDDELTALFDAGWSLGKIGAAQRGAIALKPKKQGWW